MKSAAPNFYVGIGASAGGLEALESFVKMLKPNAGMAYIIIQHLSPDYKSLMSEILSKKTELSVSQVEEGMIVEADHVYLIPPKMNLKIFNGRLTLLEHDQAKRGVNYPIDTFLQSLAEDQGRNSIGIILSGTGSDGTRGLRSIKEAAGLTLVQDIESAAFDGMPRSAIDAGLADFILTPGQMPDQLLNYANHPIKSEFKNKKNILHDEDALTRLFIQLRDRNGVDFSQYKPATVLRRIERRITINQVEDIEEYTRFVNRYPSEINLLFKELLIGVTNFFRDPDAYDALAKKHIPTLLQKQEKSHEEIRIWCAGCSTGEEAYTIAILLNEALKERDIKREIKVFATDVDKDAITYASAGQYPASISADVPGHILEKYFQANEQGFQVVRSIRESIVFAQHNLLKDPPFTKIDIVSCRNLLIYLQPSCQKKVMGLFNFSLVPDGILFLGSSETVGESEGLFIALDNKWKILKSKGIKRLAYEQQGALLFDPSKNSSLYVNRAVASPAPRDFVYDRLLERFLNVIADQYIPFGLLVNSSGELLHIVGDSRHFLRVPSGKLQTDISKLLIKELAIPVSTGIQKVIRDQAMLSYSNIRIADGDKVVQLKICPVPGKPTMEPLIAVFIEDIIGEEDRPKERSFDISKATEQRIIDLENELQFTKESLQATVEELETSNEELQATNEELLASNEELQSTNEELQSVNEELFTVNAEYQTKISELTESNNDLDNFISIVHMPTIYLDENLEIRRITPEAKSIFKLIDSDIGRPLSHIAHDLVNIDLDKIVSCCQKEGSECAKRVKDLKGKEFFMRVIPYKIAHHSYSGVVISFFDLTYLSQEDNV